MKKLMFLTKPFFFLFVVALCLLPGHIASVMGAAGLPGGQQFLDLPSGFGVSEEKEEEPPIIEFYEETYEGDAFFFCLDRSSSMGNLTQSGEIKYEVLKREAVKALQGMTKESTACVVFYDVSGPYVHGNPPVKMNETGKANMINKVQSTPISRGSCMVKGMDKTLELANKSNYEHRVIVLVADGRTHCSNAENDPEKVFNIIMQKNMSRIPINTIYTGVQSGDDWTIGKTMLERLSRSTNGKFKIAR